MIDYKKLWDKYKLPEQKRIHVILVAKVAVYLAKKLKQQKINRELLGIAAFLHDIDKAVGGPHPETAVRLLRSEGLDEIADVVKTHSLHAILDPNISPKTWEQKLLYLADKMVKYDIVGVDGRFKLWNAEHLPREEQNILDESYPKVKMLEQEVFEMAGMTLAELVKFA